MKTHKIMLTLLLLISTFWSFAQRSVSTGDTTRDTIYVSHQSKSYLLFDKAASMADVGNPSLYQAQIEGNSILVVAKEDSVADTPFYAVVGGKPFTARLVFREHPEAFYDFRKGTHSSGSANQPTPGEEALSRLKALESHQDLRYAGSQENGIKFNLVGIVHDLSATYLKFKVENRTSLVYQTDFVGFERLKRYKKGFFAQDKEASFPLEPLAEWNTKTVLPYSESYLYYALPIQSLDSKESIMATLREKAQGRSISLKISPGLNRRADLY